MSISSLLSDYHVETILDAVVSHGVTSVMITKAEPDTPIVYVNDAFTALTGYDSVNVIGKSPKLLQGPETDKSVLNRLREDLSAGRVFEGQATNYRSDCSTFTMFWRVFPVTNTNGDPVYFVALQREVMH
jgi:PAS domain S-box-containing protein